MSSRSINFKFLSLSTRPWEEVYTESIDINDSLTSSLRIFSNGRKINRVLPQYNTDLEMSCISDTTRYIVDSLILQELEYPTIKVTHNFLLNEVTDNLFGENYSPMVSVSWKKAGDVLVKKLQNLKNISTAYYIGEFLDLESLLFIKENAISLGSNNLENLTEKNISTYNIVLNEDFNKNYIFNIEDFNNCKHIFFLNLNLRIENPVLNAKFRKKYVWETKFNVFYFGESTHLTYNYTQLGLSTTSFFELYEGRNQVTNILQATSQKC